MYLTKFLNEFTRNSMIDLRHRQTDECRATKYAYTPFNTSTRHCRFLFPQVPKVVSHHFSLFPLLRRLDNLRREFHRRSLPPVIESFDKIEFSIGERSRAYGQRVCVCVCGCVWVCAQRTKSRTGTRASKWKKRLVARSRRKESKINATLWHRKIEFEAGLSMFSVNLYCVIVSKARRIHFETTETPEDRLSSTLRAFPSPRNHRRTFPVEMLLACRLINWFDTRYGRLLNVFSLLFTRTAYIFICIGNSWNYVQLDETSFIRFR